MGPQRNLFPGQNACRNIAFLVLLSAGRMNTAQSFIPPRLSSGVEHSIARTTTPTHCLSSNNPFPRHPFHAGPRRTRRLYSAPDDDDADRSSTTNGIVNGNPEGGEKAVTIDYTKIKPQAVPQRWVQLAYLSLLALLSDWVCFSVASVPSTFEANFGHSAASIIDIFLFTNVATSFLVTDVVARFGLQRAIQGAALFMAAGVWFRAGLGFLPGFQGDVLVGYPFIVIGTVLVGIAQPFFQCTPPLLSAKWFANNERSTSTAIALNFNQIGIATAFLVGGGMATTTGGLENYFGLIACMTTLVTIGTLLQFQNEPPLPPSTSELEKLIKGEKEPPFLESVQKFFSTKGFTRPLAAFICSITVTNIVGVSAACLCYMQSKSRFLLQSLRLRQKYT
jgi:hypothetical protein